MRFLLLLAGLIRLWVRVYTAGLPAHVKQDRRAEIESDLWEEVHAFSGTKSASAGFAMLTRWLLGVPADLSWSLAVWRAEFDAAKSGVNRRREKMEAQFVRKGLGAVAALAATWLIVVVAVNMAEPDQEGVLYDASAKERLGQMVSALEEGRMSKQDILAQLESFAQEAREAERERAGQSSRG